MEGGRVRIVSMVPSVGWGVGKDNSDFSVLVFSCFLFRNLACRIWARGFVF